MPLLEVELPLKDDELSVPDWSAAYTGAIGVPAFGGAKCTRC